MPWALGLAAACARAALSRSARMTAELSSDTGLPLNLRILSSPFTSRIMHASRAKPVVMRIVPSACLPNQPLNGSPPLLKPSMGMPLSWLSFGGSDSPGRRPSWNMAPTMRPSVVKKKSCPRFPRRANTRPTWSFTCATPSTLSGPMSRPGLGMVALCEPWTPG